ncbi:MAG: serine hydroxymethyltransferase [Spirochaetes bacterium]|nr:serine hydroxymethyltransferase [Spirochaetota bacterium]
MNRPLKEVDPEIFGAIEREINREFNRLELIASENIASRAVLEAQGSVLTNKYAEGYPNARYYEGCEYADEAEALAIERGKKLFKAPHINVQPHSGSQANMAVYFAVLEPGDAILGLSLSSGGHLTHGAKVNFSGKLFRALSYDVDPATYCLNYDSIRAIARKEKPRLIVAGGSAYNRIIDFKEFRSIADEIGAYLVVDMAHFGGLVAAGIYPSPVPYADFVTGTTHKTLRGPRGGYIIATKEELAKKVDKHIFPGIQGGPLIHVIAAKAVCFREALDPSFTAYQKNVVANAKTMASELMKRGYKIVSDGTDTHLMLVDTNTSKGLTGDICAKALDRAYITANKNGIPFDPKPPKVTSGIRLGTPILTTRGMGEGEMKSVVELIDRVLSNVADEKTMVAVENEVKALCKRFPIYEYLK